MAGTVEIEGNTAILNPRKPATWVAAIYTLLYLGLMGEGVKELFRALREERSPGPALLILAVFTAIWLFLVRKWNSRVIFDADARKVFAKSLFGYKELLDFDDIAEVAQVEETNKCCGYGGYDTFYYKIATKDDRFGKGIRLTASFTKRDMDQFEKEELPALLAFFERARVAVGAAPAEAEPEGEGVPAARPSRLPENTRHYRRDGAVYTLYSRTRPCVLILVSLASVVLLLTSPTRDARLFWCLVVGACFVIAFFAQTRLVFDTAARTITLVSGFGLLKKVYSFDHFDGLAVSRQVVNFIPVGTYLHLKLTNRKTPVVLSMAYLSTRKLSGIGEETMGILGAEAGAKEAIPA